MLRLLLSVPGPSSQFLKIPDVGTAPHLSQAGNGDGQHVQVSSVIEMSIFSAGLDRPVTVQHHCMLIVEI